MTLTLFEDSRGDGPRGGQEGGGVDLIDPVRVWKAVQDASGSIPATSTTRGEDGDGRGDDRPGRRENRGPGSSGMGAETVAVTGRFGFSPGRPGSGFLLTFRSRRFPRACFPSVRPSRSLTGVASKLKKSGQKQEKKVTSCNKNSFKNV